jgi:DNA polymerase III subunit delta'
LRVAKKPAKPSDDGPMLIGGDDVAPAKPSISVSEKRSKGTSKAKDDGTSGQPDATQSASPRKVSGRPVSRAGAAARETVVPLAKPAGPTVPAPVPLESILGQARALGVMKSSFASGRVHHAWVFHGPAGVGKFTAALAFAAVLLDPSARLSREGKFAFDADSPVQHLLRAGSHPDVRIVTKELAAVSRDSAVRSAKQRNIPKAVLEEFLIEPSTRSAALAGGGTDQEAGEPKARSIFIVDEADLIDVAGQNTLLKTLEEPAPGRVIMLITSAPEQLLPTVLSRCQRVAFAGLSVLDMDRWLAQVLRSEASPTSDLSPEAREWLLGFADGSPGLAWTAMTTGLIEWHTALKPMLDCALAGSPPIELGETLAKLVDQWAETQIEGKPTASKEAAKAAGLEHLLRLIGVRWRVELRREAAADKAREGAGTLRAIEALSEAERYLAANVQPGFVFEQLSSALATA